VSVLESLAHRATWTTQSWSALGTTAVLCVSGDATAARRAVQRELDAIDRAASRFRPDSELERLNRTTGCWTRVSPLLLEAVELGIRAAVMSGGAVDPTLGQSLIDVGYDRDWDTLRQVDADAGLATARGIVVIRRRRTLWREIETRADPPQVRLPAGVRLDLGATAKALAADRSARAARGAGGPGALVALGGDVSTEGPSPAGGWKVHVTDDHRAGTNAPGQTVSVTSGGLATSSIVVRRWLHHGRPMHHILDPRDGQPVRSCWRTVSVAAASCADANIAATAAIVLGEDALRWLAEQSLPARLVRLDGTVEVTAGWPR
jgi:thiamine biosynthesis lipoprotein